MVEVAIPFQQLNTADITVLPHTLISLHAAWQFCTVKPILFEKVKGEARKLIQGHKYKTNQSGGAHQQKSMLDVTLAAEKQIKCFLLSPNINICCNTRVL